MEGLKNIINVLEQITKEHGSIDNYYNNHKSVKEGKPYYLAKELADTKSRYKLKNMGIALVCEYFKNIGIDIAKPDTHIKRMLKNVFGKEFTDKEAINKIKDISEKTEITQIEIDHIMWWYCSEENGEICTTKNPKCCECVIKAMCKNCA